MGKVIVLLLTVLRASAEDFVGSYDLEDVCAEQGLTENACLNTACCSFQGGECHAATDRIGCGSYSYTFSTDRFGCLYACDIWTASLRVWCSCVRVRVRVRARAQGSNFL